MKSPLHILHLEDDPNDAALVQSTLETGNIACATTCVQSRDDFVAALEHGGVDLILSDFSMPSFDGMSALKIAHARWPAIPFILVSGTLGEERAIDSLKSGATDYVLKERLSRLIPAVHRAMREAEERRQLERAVSSLSQFAAIVESSEDAIISKGLDSIVATWNKGAEKIFGYSADEMVGNSIMRLIPADRQDEESQFLSKIEHGESMHQFETIRQAKDGRLLDVSVTVSPIKDAKGKIIGVSKVARDITEKKRLQAQFIEAQKMDVIGQLAGGVAHDFNNILAVIIGYSDLMMPELAPDSPLQKYTEEIRNAAERAAGLTRQLLVFSRKQTVQLVVLDLNDVVADLDKMLRRLIDESIAMTIVPGKQIGRIKADPGHIGQVLMNLVVNARDAMPKGGKISIATHNVTLDKNYVHAHTGVIPGHYVMLSVSDTGTGMTDEVKTRLFEAFFTTKPKGKGTGLGLATCQTVVRQSGGHVGVYSEIGKGTTFKIYFPRVEQPLDVVDEPIQTGPLPRGTETLLVVEDDPSVRHLARGVLEVQGYEVLSASNGQDALHVAREHKGSLIRLVVTDVIMPLMGGKVMAEWLKTTYPDLKILFTSGYTDDAIAQHGVLEPGVAFLSKPYSPAVLVCKVREMLDNETDTALIRKERMAINQNQ
jgi:PAS domain S-box-containing protein